MHFQEHHARWESIITGKKEKVKGFVRCFIKWKQRLGIGRFLVQSCLPFGRLLVRACELVRHLIGADFNFYGLADKEKKRYSQSFN